MPEEPCPECEPITTRSSAGIEVRRFTTESAGPMPEGHVMAHMPERLLTYRASAETIKLMRNIARKGARMPVRTEPTKARPSAIPQTQTRREPSEIVISGPHYLGGSVVAAGPLVGQSLARLGLLKDPDQEERGKEVDPGEILREKRALRDRGDEVADAAKALDDEATEERRTARIIDLDRDDLLDEFGLSDPPTAEQLEELDEDQLDQLEDFDKQIEEAKEKQKKLEEAAETARERASEITDELKEHCDKHKLPEEDDEEKEDEF